MILASACAAAASSRTWVSGRNTMSESMNSSHSASSSARNRATTSLRALEMFAPEIDHTLPRQQSHPERSSVRIRSTNDFTKWVLTLPGLTLPMCTDALRPTSATNAAVLVGRQMTEQVLAVEREVPPFAGGDVPQVPDEGIEPLGLPSDL